VALELLEVQRALWLQDGARAAALASLAATIGALGRLCAAEPEPGRVLRLGRACTQAAMEAGQGQDVPAALAFSERAVAALSRLGPEGAGDLACAQLLRAVSRHNSGDPQGAREDLAAGIPVLEREAPLHPERTDFGQLLAWAAQYFGPSARA
jgi:hypothetical protein